MYAIILTGGKGTRLGELTRDKPKSMVEMGDNWTILEYQVAQLKQAGVTDIIIAETEESFPKIIQDHFGNGERFGLRIEHLVLNFEFGSCGSIKEAIRQIPPEEKDVIVMYGDIITKAPISDLVEAHREIQNWGVILAVRHQSPFGQLEITDEGKIISFKEKPVSWINGSVFVLSTEIVNLLADQGDFSRKVLTEMSAAMHPWKYDGYWRDVGTHGELEAAREDARRGAFDEIIKETIPPWTGKERR